MAGSDEVNRNIDEFFRRRRAALYALGERYAAKSEAHAKQEAKWEDRTGDARRGLFGEVAETAEALRIRIAHAEQHGVYLELANQGRYAILDPTAKKLAPEFVQDAERVIKG